MRMRREPPVQVKTPAQLGRMREAGLMVARRAGRGGSGRAARGQHRRAGRDRRAAVITGAGATASFLGYHGYPGHASASRSTTRSCTGSRAADRLLAAGDLVSIDCGAIVAGWHGDAARTIIVGVGPPGRRRRADRGLRGGPVAGPGRGPGRRTADRHLARGRDQRTGQPGGTASWHEYVGHGIGTEMHMDPPVPNYGQPGRGPLLAEGMALAIEPMLTARPGRHPAAGRRLDGGHGGRSLAGALRAHRGDHRGRAVGADRARTAAGPAPAGPGPAGPCRGRAGTRAATPATG